MAWDVIPQHRRSIVRAYINSENEQDRERAHELCNHYGLDYALMRRIISQGTIREGRKLGKAWTPAEGSRPLSPGQPAIDISDPRSEEKAADTAARDGARKARAVAYLQEKPKAGKPWTSKTYVYDKDEER